MNYKIQTVQRFDKEIKKLSKKYKSIKSDLQNLVFNLREKPTIGISLGQDIYKIRMAISSKAKGKSGGARVITCVKIIRETVYLISIFDKSEKDSISDKEILEILEEEGLL